MKLLNMKICNSTVFEANGKTLENSFVLYENLYEMDNNKEVRRGAAKSSIKL